MPTILLAIGKCASVGRSWNTSICDSQDVNRTTRLVREHFIFFIIFRRFSHRLVYLSFISGSMEMLLN